MIIPNGYISARLAASPGEVYDEAGLPAVTVDTGWGSPMPCQYVAEAYNAMSRDNNREHRTAVRYTVFVDGTAFKAGRVRLMDARRTAIGEFTVISVTPLRAVNQTQIKL